ncbi:MAG TPA: gliding motility-associated C-terminal domain-containing protein [Elusimicrobiota bacterium]|nr:gliding motility-associated C-terminal domain-containing protein [Elusimicrobiota bacterium]
MNRTICDRLVSPLAALGLVAALGLSSSAFPTAFGLARPSVARSISIGDLTLTAVRPRIITPNGDGANDKVRFEFDNPEDLPVQGEVFDLSGAKVADLKPGSDPASLLLWDGKDADNRVVPGGIYLYQIEYQGKQATGTVIVAR